MEVGETLCWERWNACGRLSPPPVTLNLVANPSKSNFNCPSFSNPSICCLRNRNNRQNASLHQKTARRKLHADGRFRLNFGELHVSTRLQIVSQTSCHKHTKMRPNHKSCMPERQQPNRTSHSLRLRVPSNHSHCRRQKQPIPHPRHSTG